MKQLLIGIFAHPDDEAFGPSAFLHSQAESGTAVHLILVTDGESGQNDGHKNLSEVRLQEWLESGRRIGAVSNFALHYPDGGLCNNLYLEITGKIITHITAIIAGYDEPVSVGFVTFEDRGISGHLDHIAVSFMTTYVYKKFEEKLPTNAQLDRLRYYCLPQAMIEQSNCAWLYMPAGRSEDLIDETLSYIDKIEMKHHIMRAHVSQKRDMDAIMAQWHDHADDPAVYAADHFIFYK